MTGAPAGRRIPRSGSDSAALVEAANFAIRYHERGPRCHNRNWTKRNRTVAPASHFMTRDRVSLTVLFATAVLRQILWTEPESNVCWDRRSPEAAGRVFPHDRRPTPRS